MERGKRVMFNDDPKTFSKLGVVFLGDSFFCGKRTLQFFTVCLQSPCVSHSGEVHEALRDHCEGHCMRKNLGTRCQSSPRF